MYKSQIKKNDEPMRRDETMNFFNEIGWIAPSILQNKF
jgi:hypothetical protein